MRITQSTRLAALLSVPFVYVLAAGPAHAGGAYVTYVPTPARVDQGGNGPLNDSLTEPGVIPAKGDTRLPPANSDPGVSVTSTSVGVGAGAAVCLTGGVLLAVLRRRRRVLPV